MQTATLPRHTRYGFTRSTPGRLRLHRVGVDTKPEILIGILKQNVVIVIGYTAYVSRSDYIRTINKDVRVIADLLSKAAS